MLTHIQMYLQKAEIRGKIQDSKGKAKISQTKELPCCFCEESVCFAAEICLTDLSWVITAVSNLFLSPPLWKDYQNLMWMGRFLYFPINIAKKRSTFWCCFVQNLKMWPTWIMHSYDEIFLGCGIFELLRFWIFIQNMQLIFCQLSQFP